MPSSHSAIVKLRYSLAAPRPLLKQHGKTSLERRLFGWIPNRRRSYIGYSITQDSPTFVFRHCKRKFTIGGPFIIIGAQTFSLENPLYIGNQSHLQGPGRGNLFQEFLDRRSGWSIFDDRSNFVGFVIRLADYF